MEATAVTHQGSIEQVGPWPRLLPLPCATPYSSAFWRSSFVLLLATFAVLPIDLLLSRWTQATPWNHELHQLFLIAESFSHGLGVLVVLATCYVLVPDARRKLWLVGGMAFSAGGLADLLKMTIHRLRPTVVEHVTSAVDTFVGIGLHGEQAKWIFDYTHQSFPSAHTATSFGLACGLAWMLGRARGYFFLMAMLASLQRIISGAHFPSDVLFGAVIGTFVAGLWLKPYGIAPYLHRLLAVADDRCW